MSRAITITVGDIEMDGEFNDSPTADAIWGALPIARTVNTWGHEFYFDIGVQAEQEPDASDVVEVGDLAYWPPGMAFCVFFGRTPASQGNEVRAASPVNVVGRIDDPPVDALRRVRTGTAIRIEAA
ncbi:MAG: cyclophilin-like fold protein [Chloroflexota bacterium]|nr:cyclophilin-like fold protein [Chloroflexota bacterium]MDE2898144.1 cyclophilin-like fold protein [Chloroflexota bacterium]